MRIPYGPVPMKSMRICSLVAGILLALVVTIPSLADTVLLVNGDRISGTVKQLEAGKLIVASDLLGTVRVQWSDVASLQSDSEFSVLTEDGRRLEGRLSRSGAETQIAMPEEEATAVDSHSITRIVPGAKGTGIRGFVATLDGAADIGYSVARGNQNQMQSSLGAHATYESAHYKASGRLDSLFARQDDARAQSRHALNLRLDRFVKASTFVYGLSGFERNERRRLDLRTRLGGGLGWRLRDSPSTGLSLVSGLAYLHEQYRRLPDRASVEGVLGVEWETHIFRGVELSINLTTHPDLFDRTNVRAELDTTLRVPISGRFTYSLRLFDRFHTKPAESVERNDYGLVSGVGITF